MAEQQPGSVKPGQNVEEAFVQVLRSNLDAVKEYEPVALEGRDIEGVHQMRVCVRRMRSALGVFRPAIPQGASRLFNKGMRRAAKRLDRARDLDVYIADNFPRKANKQQKRMRRIAARERREAYERVREFIQGKEYSALCGQFRHWLETKGWRAHLSEGNRNTLGSEITSFASSVLHSHRSRVLEDGRDIQSLDSEALHRLRISCKKLRYASEFFSPLYGDAMREFTGQLKASQDVLGILHDTAVLPALQEELLRSRKGPKLRRFAGKLASKRGRQAEGLRRSLEARWQIFSGSQPPWHVPPAGLVQDRQ